MSTVVDETISNKISLFQTVQNDVNGRTDHYIDGGVLNNYPVQCFDGWYLSLKPDDSFLKRFYPFDNFQRLYEKKERFGTYNEKTLGFVVYEEDETELLRNILERRNGFSPPEAPDTELGKEYKMKHKKMTEELEKLREQEKLNYEAVERFLRVLRKYNNNETVDIHELKNALNDPEFTDEDRQRLFGKQVTVEEAMNEIDTNDDDQIQFYDLYTFVGRVGEQLRSKFLGYRRRAFNSVISYAKTVQDVLTNNVQRLFVEEKDTERTVGINTKYIGTTDFELEQGDKDYITERGRESTEAYLKYYIETYKPPRKDAAGTTTENTEISNDLSDEQVTPSTINGVLTDEKTQE